jgi:hypothetical protein
MRRNASHQCGRRSYSAVMAKRTRRRCLPAADPDAVLAQLRSPGALVRVKAPRRICPCRAGFPLYERFRGEVRGLQKDPDPQVRAAALHAEHDACEIETIEAGLDRADEQGWRYSDPDWVSKHRQRQATGHWLPL